MKFRWKWALGLTGVALLGVSLLLAVWAFDEKDAARRAAGRRLDASRDAAARVLVDLLAEAHEKLGRSTPAQPVAPLVRVTTESGPGVVDDAELLRLESPETWFRFAAATLRVVRKDAGDAHVAGRVPYAELERRLAEVPALAARTPAVRLQFLGRRGEVLFEPSRARDERAKARGSHGSLAHARIREGERSERRSETGLPARYKDADDKAALGSWAPVPGAGDGVWVLAESADADVVQDVAGTPLEVFGYSMGEAMAWHLTLGVGLLLVIVAVLVGIPSRSGGAQVGVLLRTYRFARPYAWGIAGAVAVGAIFGFSRSLRAFLVKSMVDDVLVNQGPDAHAAIWGIVWATLALGAVLAVSNYFKEYLQNYYSTAMMADIRIALARKIVSLPLPFFNRMRAGDLVARIERDVAGMRQVLMNVFEKAFVQPFTLVGAVVIAFMMNWKLALVLFGLPILISPVFRIAKRIKKRAEKRQNLLADISHVQFQMLSGIKVVKAFHGEEREAQRLDKANRRFIHEARRIARLSAFSASLMDFLQMVGGAIVVGAGGFYVLEGEVEVGDLAGFLIVMVSVYDSAKDITSVLNKLIESLPAVQRVFEIFDTKNDLADGPVEAPPGPLTEGITLEGVRFRYLENDVLKDVSLHVPAGKVVAVVGPTGAGKTTLCDLIVRFYDPTEGRVLWDGVDAREFTTKSLAARFAIVTQDAFLFNAPIDENIRYGRESATRAEVEAAAKDANVHDEIVAMEGGYAKLAGERGASLSGGQRQRVTIARALIKDAPVLVLDEATSNLDTHSEQRVQAALAKLMQGRTVIIVAHRLSTIRNADKVVVLDGGRIVEEGSWDELMRNPSGRFRAMVDAQRGEDGGGAAEVAPAFA